MKDVSLPPTVFGFETNDPKEAEAFGAGAHQMLMFLELLAPNTFHVRRAVEVISERSFETEEVKYLVRARINVIKKENS